MLNHSPASCSAVTVGADASVEGSPDAAASVLPSLFRFPKVAYSEYSRCLGHGLEDAIVIYLLGSLEILVKFGSTVVPVYLRIRWVYCTSHRIEHNGLLQKLNERTLCEYYTGGIPVHHSWFAHEIGRLCERVIRSYRDSLPSLVPYPCSLHWKG